MFKPIARAMTAAGVMTAVLLSGCAVQMPDTAGMMREVTPAQWSVTVVQKGDAVLMKAFWQRWNDPVLPGLIEAAQAANPDVLSALASLRAARASLTEANASLWPSGKIGANAETRRVGGSTSDSYSADAELSWTVNLAGGTWAARDAKAWNAYAKALSVADTREMIAAETAQAYVNLRAAEEKLRVIKESVHNYSKTAQIADWRAQAGLSSRSEAEDALVQLATAQARIPETEASIAGYRNALARLTATPVDRLMLSAAAGVPAAPEGIAVSIPAETLMRRPDVQSSLAAIRSAAETVRKAQTDYFPSLSLTGSVGTQAATIGALGASGSGIAALAGALSMPVLNWGSLEAQEETARAGLDEAKAGYLSVLLSALEETDNALQGIRSAELREGSLASALEHARKTYELTDLEYRSGIGDYSMLLTAQRSLLSVEESVITNRASRSNQYVMLYRALGGAWDGTQTQMKE